MNTRPARLDACRLDGPIARSAARGADGGHRGGRGQKEDEWRQILSAYFGQPHGIASREERALEVETETVANGICAASWRGPYSRSYAHTHSDTRTCAASRTNHTSIQTSQLNQLSARRWEKDIGQPDERIAPIRLLARLHGGSWQCGLAIISWTAARLNCPHSEWLGTGAARLASSLDVRASLGLQLPKTTAKNRHSPDALAPRFIHGSPSR